MLHQYQQKVTVSETKRHVGVDVHCDSIMHRGECSRLHTESVAGSRTLCFHCMLNMRNDNYRPMTVMFGHVFQPTPILIRGNSRQEILAHRTFMKMLLNRPAMAIHYQAPEITRKSQHCSTWGWQFTLKYAKLTEQLSLICLVSNRPSSWMIALLTVNDTTRHLRLHGWNISYTQFQYYYFNCTTNIRWF